MSFACLYPLVPLGFHEILLLYPQLYISARYEVFEPWLNFLFSKLGSNGKNSSLCV